MELRTPPQAAPLKREVWAQASGFVLIFLLGGLSGAALSHWLTSHFATYSTARAEAARDVASKLTAAGVISEAAVLYEQYINAAPRSPERGSMAYSLANLYLEEGQPKKALRWLYEAELDAAADLHEPLSKKLVHTLESLGRVQAARQRLAAETQLKTPAAHSNDDPVVATVGDETVNKSAVLRALDDLPPEVSQQYKEPKAHQEFLRKYVADLLLWKKAQRLELDRDADIERRLAQAHKQLTVAKFIDAQVLSKINVSDLDLQNYFAANKNQYQTGEKAARLEDVRPQVEHDYRMMKSRAAYQELINKELAATDVKIFADKWAP